MFSSLVKNIPLTVTGISTFLLIVWVVTLKIEISVHKEDKAVLISRIEHAVSEKAAAQNALERQNQAIAKDNTALNYAKNIAALEKQIVKKDTAIIKAAVNKDKTDSETITAVRTHLENFLGK